MAEGNGPARRGALYLGMAAAMGLTLAGGGAFWYAAQRNAASTAGQAADMVVRVGTTECRPNEITVPGGRRSFEIVNESDRPIEWEILDGVMVVAERENIAPGFRQILTAQLAPGSYQITCGLLSNPRGVLHVTQSDEAQALASEVTLKKFLGPLAEYRVYLVTQGRRAVTGAEALRDAIAAGDLEAARAAWLAARAPYRRIEALAMRFSDLENAIDPGAAYLAGREQDPAFTGYHRLEYGLFAVGSLDGLAPLADRLVRDLQALSDRLGEARLDPQLMIALPASLAGQLAQGQIPAGENDYSGSDPADLRASLEGLEKLVGLLRPVLAGADPALDAELGEALQRVETSLAGITATDYRAVPEAGRAGLAASMAGLQAALEKLPSAMGLAP